MSRRTRKAGHVGPIESSAPITKAIFAAARKKRFLRDWRTVDDWARILAHLFRLEDTKAKGMLTGEKIMNCLKTDHAVKSSIDLLGGGLNLTGIFRNQYIPSDSGDTRKKVWCLYLAPPGENIPTYKSGVLWYHTITRMDLRPK